MRSIACLNCIFWRGPVLLAVAFTLAGCVSVGPDYVEPELAVPDAWHMRIVQQVEQGPQATLQTWWTVSLALTA